MAEQAQLLLLKSRLRKIRRDKRNISILLWVIGFILVTIVWGLLNWKDNFITDLWFLIIWVIIGVTGWLAVIGHYNAEEAQVVWQIKQLTRKSSPTTSSELMKSLLR